MAKETKRVSRAQLNQAVGIPEKFQPQNDPTFSGFVHEDNCTESNDKDLIITRNEKGNIEKLTPCCNHLSGITDGIYWDKV